MADILIMEDETQAAIAISEALAEIGHRTDITHTGSEALRALNESRYDLLITDLYVRRDGTPFPDGGIKLIGHVRQCARGPEYEWLREIPIIAISGATRSLGQVDLFNLAKSVGANEAVAKPLNFDAFKKLVERLLAD